MGSASRTLSACGLPFAFRRHEVLRNDGWEAVEPHRSMERIRSVA